MSLEKLIKNSIDTDNGYASLFGTTVTLYENWAECLGDESDIIIGAYRVAAKSLQEAMWSEWRLWLESHNCTKEDFHKAIVNVIKEGVEKLEEARMEEEFRRYVNEHKAA